MAVRESSKVLFDVMVSEHDLLAQVSLSLCVGIVWCSPAVSHRDIALIVYCSYGMLLLVQCSSVSSVPRRSLRLALFQTVNQHRSRESTRGSTDVQSLPHSNLHFLLMALPSLNNRQQHHSVTSSTTTSTITIIHTTTTITNTTTWTVIYFLFLL